MLEKNLQLENPLKLKFEQPPNAPPKQLGTQIIEKLSPLSRNDIEGIVQAGAEPGSDNLTYLSGELGIPETRLYAAIERGHGATYDGSGLIDSIAVELLKKNGYDSAIQMSRDPRHLREIMHIPK